MTKVTIYSFLIVCSILTLCSAGHSQTEGQGKITFYSTRDGHHEIYVFDAAGDNLRRLTFGDANNNCPAWSPDGKRIAFLSDCDGNDEGGKSVATGIYLYRFQAGDHIETKKMLLLK